MWANEEFWGLGHFKNTKTEKLSIDNDRFLKTEAEFTKFPVLSDGVNGNVRFDVGGPIKRMHQKLMECKEEAVKNNGGNKSILGKNAARYYKKIKKDGSGFCVNAPLGKTSIRELFKSAFRRMGISNWETLRPHSCRGWMVTNMANDPSVSLKQTMAAARHFTAQSSIEYQKTDAVSACNRLNSLLKHVGSSDTNDNTNEKQAIKEEEEKKPSFVSVDQKPPALPLNHSKGAAKSTPETVESSSPESLTDGIVLQGRSQPNFNNNFNSNFSEFTQAQYDNLQNGLQDLAAVQHANYHLQQEQQRTYHERNQEWQRTHHRPVDYRMLPPPPRHPIYSGAFDTNPVPIPARIPSERENYIAHLRGEIDRLHRIERRRFHGEEDRERRNFLRRTSPYREGSEAQGLYTDYMISEIEREYDDGVERLRREFEERKRRIEESPDYKKYKPSKYGRKK